MEWSGVDWTELDWSGAERSGVEWIGVVSPSGVALSLRSPNHSHSLFHSLGNQVLYFT